MNHAEQCEMSVAYALRVSVWSVTLDDGSVAWLARPTDVGIDVMAQGTSKEDAKRRLARLLVAEGITTIRDRRAA